MVTAEQIKAAERGETIRVKGDVELVLVRADTYDKLVQTFDPRETYPSVVEALADEDPEQYLEYLDEWQR